MNRDRFRTLLERGFSSFAEEKSPGRHPPYDYMVRFKILLIAELYNLSDDATEYIVNVRRTFQRFIGIDDFNTVPDAKSI